MTEEKAVEIEVSGADLFFNAECNINWPAAFEPMQIQLCIPMGDISSIKYIVLSLISTID